MTDNDPNLRLADETTTPLDLFKARKLGPDDRRTLRRLTGQETLQDWLDGGRVGPPPPVVEPRTMLVCGARARAVEHAQLLARVAPWSLIPEVTR